MRSVSLHPTLPLVAAVGMDRHLRIYHIGTQKVLKKVRADHENVVVRLSREREKSELEVYVCVSVCFFSTLLVTQVYLKQRLNCVLFSSRCEVLGSVEHDADTNDISDAALWSHLDQNATVNELSNGGAVKSSFRAGATAARSTVSASTSVRRSNQDAQQSASDDEDNGDDEDDDDDEDGDNDNDESDDDADDDDEDEVAQQQDQVKPVRSSIGAASKRKSVNRPHQSHASEKKGKYSK